MTRTPHLYLVARYQYAEQRRPATACIRVGRPEHGESLQLASVRALDALPPTVLIPGPIAVHAYNRREAIDRFQPACRNHRLH